AAFEVLRNEEPEPAAVIELMLLHVRQQGERAASAVFPAEVAARLRELAAQSAGLPAAGPPSRRIELRSRAGGAA
ncbi:MAG: thioesterase, partial [Candidatus Eremiobacteraeota bacterium]|nr:thioesterase [Candidatus Eremiobacteraeota bacterium]